MSMLSPPEPEVWHASASHGVDGRRISTVPAGEACAANGCQCAAGCDSHTLQDTPSVEGDVARMQLRFPYALPRNTTIHDGPALHTSNPFASGPLWRHLVEDRLIVDRRPPRLRPACRPARPALHRLLDDHPALDAK